MLITKDSEAWNDIGVPALVEDTHDDTVSGYHLALLRPFPERVDGGYLFRALQSSAVAYQFHVQANGVTRYGLSHSAIRSVWLPLPPLSEQAAIVSFLDRATADLDAATTSAQRETSLLREYRTRLIADVVTGKLDVREAAARLPKRSRSRNRSTIPMPSSKATKSPPTISTLPSRRPRCDDRHQRTQSRTADLHRPDRQPLRCRGDTDRSGKRSRGRHRWGRLDLRCSQRLRPRVHGRSGSTVGFPRRHATGGGRIASARRGRSGAPKFLVRLQGEIAKRGTIDVLRHGLKHGAHDLDIFYGTPSAGNVQAQQRFEQNRFTVVRQLRYSRDETQRALDLGLFINGLPVFTFELKNSLTQQTVHDAVWQYQKDRNPREKLFEFGRCVAHFAVDESDVRFCSHLKGKASWFLPSTGAGTTAPVIHPTRAASRPTTCGARVLTRESLTDILENYAQVVEVKDEKTGKKTRTQIWPRYQQLDVVRGYWPTPRRAGRAGAT